MSETLQWADAHFSAAHRGNDGSVHGHTWRVRVYWTYAGQNIAEQRARLMADVEQLDHSELHADLERAEDIAEWFGLGLKAQRVDVWREAEGLGASWTA